MSRLDHSDIRIGTLIQADAGASYLAQILPHGFESFEITFGGAIGPIVLEDYAREIRETLCDRAGISCLGLYGNPLTDPQAAQDLARLIDSAHLFGCSLVCGFAGALEDRPVDQSLPRFAEVFGPLARRAEDRGVRIAFENCDMGGTWEHPRWNIAHSPRAWRMMFEAVPSPALGLEWEPCHQMVSLIDPIPQLREWASRVFHVHGKDATILHDKIRRDGIRCGEHVVLHRTPGFGDSNWTEIISILRAAGFKGSIDIEGWHDPVYCGDLEMTGQVRALEYLKACRGGPFVPNPA
ncbi:MAG TPA: sugar phosphate isomerase/epimerase family protein [Fimbriimonadaceae bacterium]|nr:sugar phosphate isomerase/epimerase family protein [Fimbriimonadaceae bacterium]HRJ34152.1 sugar phosphate isomerase/epimerase family protein [Fimbriimonadaceae bacterium]